MNGSPALTLEGADDQAGQQTDTVLIAAQVDKRIAVYQIYVSAAAAMKLTFESGTSTWKHAQHAAAGGGSVVPFTGIPWFVCDKGEALTYSTDVGAGIIVSVKAAAV
jgi:hypothetical protein